MVKFCSTYSDTMPNWLMEAFFDPKMTTQRLNTHEYQQSENVRKLRSMENLYLIDFNPILDRVFGHPILDGGGAKKPPHLNFE